MKKSSFQYNFLKKTENSSTKFYQKLGFAQVELVDSEYSRLTFVTGSCNFLWGPDVIFCINISKVFEITISGSVVVRMIFFKYSFHRTLFSVFHTIIEYNWT